MVGQTGNHGKGDSSEPFVALIEADGFRAPDRGREEIPGGPPIGAVRVNSPVSGNFTDRHELTLFRYRAVGGFDKPQFGRRPLTIVFRLRARVNPVGTELAFLRSRRPWWACGKKN